MIKRIIWAATFLIFSSTVCFSQLPSTSLVQLATLSASDGSSGTYFGVSTAISGDTVVVGSNNANSNSGAAYVFVRPITGWGDMVQTAKLTASDGKQGDGFGDSVSISGDTIVIGAPNHQTGTLRQGAAFVFSKPATGWHDMTETAKLTASDEGEGDSFGQSVAISGNTIAIGSTGNNNFQGSAYVYLKPSTGWKTTSRFQAKLTDNDDPNGMLGIAVSVSGNTVVAGAYNNNGAPGAAYVFVRPTSGWTSATQTAKLTASDGDSADLFALNLAICGNTVLVGARNDPSNGITAGPGAAYLFVEPPSGWIDATETAKLTASDAVEGSGFGSSVALNDKAAVVGAAFYTVGENQGQGAAYVFKKPLTGWQTTALFNSKLTAVGGTANSYFGFATSISGTTIAIGGYAANSFEGSEYVFGK